MVFDLRDQSVMLRIKTQPQIMFRYECNRFLSQLFRCEGDYADFPWEAINC